MRIENNYSVKAHNTFGINQITKRFIEYSSADELKELIKSGKLEQPFFHIGAGSNLLFAGIFLVSARKIRKNRLKGGA